MAPRSAPVAAAAAFPRCSPILRWAVAVNRDGHCSERASAWCCAPGEPERSAPPTYHKARTQHSCHQVQSDGRVRSLMRRGGSVRTPSNSKGLWCIRRSEFNWDRLPPVDYGAPDCPALCLPGIILPVAD